MVAALRTESTVVLRSIFHLGTWSSESNFQRMSDFKRMSNSADALRRWLGAFCLAVAAGMLIWGQTILLPYLQGIVFLLYWFLCFAFTFAAIFIACLDLRAVLRRIRNEQAELIQRTLAELEQPDEDDQDKRVK